MTIWVDADSCPVPVREIIAKAARARKIPAVFAANRRIPLKRNAYVHALVVQKTEGSADACILRGAEAGDLIITRDIPLAAELVKRGLRVINDRGNAFTGDTIAERLSIRDFMKELRDIGLYESPEGSFGAKEVKLFADTFDRELTRLSARTSVKN
ncbi:MAG: DUF188 domain-containing protein [Spirochaetales bacterium]|jgi:uncharacterized protein YaiI (UPF0178 family)|nr:DUF188 domain-containing protein [Spirochaetales bacterium]